MVTPTRRILENSQSHFTEGVFEVAKHPIPPLTFPPSRTVLIVKVKSRELWPSGIPLLERQISQETDAAFKGTLLLPAHNKVYWIEAIGPHWRFGEKNDDGQDPTALIDWHDVIHDEASFADFQVLAGLVASMMLSS